MALSLSNLDIISKISVLMQGDVSSESAQTLVRQRRKCLKVCLIVDWMFGGAKQKSY